MRRAQSVRHYARPSIALASEDLGMLREGNETDEDVLRKQLIEKDRECDKLRELVHNLESQLVQRPPIEDIQEIQKEYKNLELLLQGTQRENERCMAELERSKQREKLLERKLCELAGENWQSSLDIPPAAPNTLGLGGRANSIIHSHQRSHTISASSPLVTTLAGLNSPSASSSRSPRSHTTHSNSPNPESLSASQGGGARASGQKEREQHEQREEEEEAKRRALFANIEQMKLLIMGMEQRAAAREEKLGKTVERAEKEGGRFEALRRDLAEVAVDG
ncbi:hypothetical protein DFP72DRAFT_1033659 [Ephemerocybe angulata]|uniref:Uncharacterized protein n=1 Tax=Ephemerocybe angulata TaxID=980116 RepID=A0A8H6HWU3_9AGAR|nr:hypothetical protein DFP72DRAFT_1033659 [Tulosesus angulatus]